MNKYPIRAILIDPAVRSITEVEYDGEWRSIPEKHLQCDVFDAVTADIGTIFVDDEGLYNETYDYCLIEGIPQPLAGRLLLFGPTDEEGDATPCILKIEQIERMIRWISKEKAKEILGPESEWFQVFDLDTGRRL